jgi:single-strand DNA-binding protein
MEQLNKVEIRGIIGSVYVKEFGNAKVANFSVATESCYTSQDGSKVIEVTWHRVVAWEGKQIQGLSQLKKGSGVHVIGRLRMQKYMATDGCERSAYEILANSVEPIK